MVGIDAFGGPEFDAEDEFVPEHLPEPGPFLEEGDVLIGDRHVTIHATARELFEERTVYDPTFGYNLARLNEDPRHPDAGYRYAEMDGILRAEFTPTTPFCPQTATLAVASSAHGTGSQSGTTTTLSRCASPRCTTGAM